MSPSLRLGELLPELDLPPPVAARAVSGLSQDSRDLRRGEAFVALAGTRSHGLAHAAQALAAGAGAILYEPPAPAAAAAPPAAIAVPGLRARLGELADRCYGMPSQQVVVIGVTGTNGKTSTVQLLAQALDEADGRRAGSIGTLGSGLAGALRAGERTTPDVCAVHRLLAQMREEGAGWVAMEVSSHALDQGRVDGVRFRVAVFTNLSRDHLDYHGDMAAYGAAKERLFAWPGLAAAVVNLDDEFGCALYARLPSGLRRIGLSSRGRVDAALRAEDPVQGVQGVGFDLVASGGMRVVVRSPLLGRFNIDNLLAVAGVLHALDWPLPAIARRLGELRPVPGRMQRLGGEGGRPLVVVDYAHTPDALAQTLESLRAHARGRLICVFGCGGERDAGKRPQMAAIAERAADRVIVTDDNPRGEDGAAIVADILAGFARPQAVRIERDRAAAIARAIAEAAAEDVVLIAGKGHETYQEIAGIRHPFDDADLAQRGLEARP